MPDASVPNGQRTVFRDGMVFDGSGAPPVPADVVVRGSVIESVRVGGGTEVLPNDSVVDCAGLTIMPGLVDSHSHLTFPSALGHIDPSFNPPLDVSFFHHMPTPEEHLGIAKRNAGILLDHGFTAAAAGEQATESGVWLNCHAQNPSSIKLAVRNGFRSIYHCSYADAEAIDLLDEAKDSIFLSPAVGIMWANVHAGAPPVLLMHGDSDALVPADQSIRFAAALAAAGGTATLELVAGASHFWDGAADVPGIVARSAGFVRSLAPAPA